jgi:hypothetical protein
MTTAILAGGLRTRLAEEAHLKPMQYDAGRPARMGDQKVFISDTRKAQRGWAA